jgi:hypothetical protein
LLLLAVAAPASASPRAAPHLPTRVDTRLVAALARLGSSFHGWAGLYVEDLRTGRYAGWNENAAFPAASTVKVAVLAEGIRRFGYGPRSPIDRDLRAIGEWSSNESANRVFALVGGVVPVGRALRRLGMFSSTYPGPYLVEDERRPASVPVPVPSPPPRYHSRVTTARDLARALFRLQAAAARQRWAVRDTGLSAPAAQAALAYLALASPGASLLAYPGGARHVEKNGWLDDVRATAAIAYLRRGNHIVVVLAYRPGISQSEARELGRRVSALAFRQR